jgi:hypothetical protein
VSVATFVTTSLEKGNHVMQQDKKILARKHTRLSLGLIVIFSLALVGCLSGGAGSSSTNTSAPTAADIAAITPTQIATYSDAQIIALGSNFNSLSDAALAVLSSTIGGGHPAGQIQSITAAEFATLSPAQARLIGAAATSIGGVLGTSQIFALNSAAWAVLGGNPLQVAAITAAEIPTLYDTSIVALGTNINLLSNSDIAALTSTIGAGHPAGQIESITAAQIATLTPAQVRLIGAAATGAGGVLGTSQIFGLNSAAWAVLGSDPLQVAAITADEIPTLYDSSIVALGTRINLLSNADIAALTSTVGAGHAAGQIESITAAQIATLTPAQVRLIGAAATGAGGLLGASQIYKLNTAAWGVLVADPLQVSAITAAEIPTFYDSSIVTLGSNFNSLSNTALTALTSTVGAGHPAGQIQSVTATQIAGLSPAQIGVIAGINANTGIAFLNAGAFGSLSAPQIAILTTPQKASLSTAQHTACGC